jgi:hypothetical protein
MTFRFIKLLTVISGRGSVVNNFQLKFPSKQRGMRDHSSTVRYSGITYTVWLEVLTAVTMKMAVFWVVAPCGLVRVYHSFRGLYCLHHQGDRQLVNLHQSTQRYNPEDSHLKLHNVKWWRTLHSVCTPTFWARFIQRHFRDYSVCTQQINRHISHDDRFWSLIALFMVHPEKKK